MTTCYLCGAPTDDTSGLCVNCLRASWHDHVLASIPPDNLDAWPHKEPDVWYWSRDERGGEFWACLPLSQFVAGGYPADFRGWEYGGNHATDPAPEPKSADELGHDLAVIIAVQIEQITHLTVDNRRLQADLLTARVATSLRHWN